MLKLVLMRFAVNSKERVLSDSKLNVRFLHYFTTILAFQKKNFKTLALLAIPRVGDSVKCRGLSAVLSLYDYKPALKTN